MLVIASLFVYIFNIREQIPELSNQQKVTNAWEEYKEKFIFNGMVLRNDTNDVVSEGQAYAMLRAVLLDDRIIFDQCYQWTEKNLSRREALEDNLLAWNFKNGRIVDWNSASDANLDYAFSLFLAYLQWNENGYLEQAKAVAKDILEHETVRNDSGRLYLLPWHSSNGEKVAGRIVQNPSYYSPAYFKVFYKLTKDERWNELVQTGYFLLNYFHKNKKVSLVPDWCSVDVNDHVGPFEGKSNDFAWEAVRVPLRLALDYYLFKDSRANKINQSIYEFLFNSYVENKKLSAGYRINGDVLHDYEHSIIYAIAHILAKSYAPVSEYPREFKTKFYKSYDSNNYYSSSLVWLLDWLALKEEKADDLKERIVNFVG